MDLSIVMPVYNEEENVQILYDNLMAVLPGSARGRLRVPAFLCGVDRVLEG